MGLGAWPRPFPPGSSRMVVAMLCHGICSLPMSACLPLSSQKLTTKQRWDTEAEVDKFINDNNEDDEDDDNINN